MRKFHYFSICLTFGRLLAQDNTCAVLLQQGIYDTYKQKSGAVNASQFHTNLCDAYSRYKQDQQAGSIQANYGVFGGGGSYSASQLDVIGRAMCTATDSSAYSQNDLSIASSTINPQAVLAFSDCMKQFAYGMRTQSVIRESDSGHIDLSINYVATPGSPNTTDLKYVKVSPETSWACAGTLWDKRNGGIALDNSVYSLSCERVFNPTTVDGRQYKAMGSTITVSTANATITRNFDPEPAAPPPPPGTFPVGSIIPFWGTKADADQQKSLGWWPCDGSLITDQLSRVYNTKAPNLDGVFLRGSTTSQGQGGGSASFHVPDQTIDSTYNGWSAATGPEMWVLKGGMGFASGSILKETGTYKGLDVPTLPPFQTVVYLIRIR